MAQVIPIQDSQIALLTKAPVLACFGEQWLRYLRDNGLLRIVRLGAGEEFIRQGQWDTWVFFLLKGGLSVFSQEEGPLARCQCLGDVVGEMGPLWERARSASVRSNQKESLCLALDMAFLDRQEVPAKVKEQVRAELARVAESRRQECPA